MRCNLDSSRTSDQFIVELDVALTGFVPHTLHDGKGSIQLYALLHGITVRHLHVRNGVITVFPS